MNDLNQMSCEEFADVAAELALGVLTGRERAGALAHLDHCESCRDMVRQLTLTGEQLLGLLPASEPPPGFETRVLERIGVAAPTPSPGTHRSHRARRGHHPGHGRLQVAHRRLLAAAAVVLAVVAAGLGGWGLRAASTPAAARSPLSSAALVSADHQQAGQIFMYAGNPSWLYMSVDMTTNSANDTVICQVVGTNGRVTTVGSFPLNDGYGSWGSAVPAGTGPLAGARLVSKDGTVLATAMFPTR